MISNETFINYIKSREYDIAFKVVFDSYVDFTMIDDNIIRDIMHNIDDDFILKIAMETMTMYNRDLNREVEYNPLLKMIEIDYDRISSLERFGAISYHLLLHHILKDTNIEKIDKYIDNSPKNFKEVMNYLKFNNMKIDLDVLEHFIYNKHNDDSTQLYLYDIVKKDELDRFIKLWASPENYIGDILSFSTYVSLFDKDSIYTTLIGIRYPLYTMRYYENIDFLKKSIKFIKNIDDNNLFNDKQKFLIKKIYKQSKSEIEKMLDEYKKYENSPYP